MADHEDAVRDQLLAHNGVSNLVGSRVWYSALVQDATLPATTIQQISGVPTSAMGSDVGQVRVRVQTDSWASDRAGAKALGEQVRDAMQRVTVTHGGVTLTVVDMNDGGTRYESEGKIWRHRQDFELWGTE